MKRTTYASDPARPVEIDLDEPDIVVVDDESAAFTPIPHGLILRTSPGPVYVMGDDGKWHRHSTVRS